jgi:hypothetical protein
MQPLMPDGNLLAVKRGGFYSDIYPQPVRPAVGQADQQRGARRSYDTGDLGLLPAVFCGRQDHLSEL